MKNKIKILVLFISISFLFTGCYTMVWDPYQEFPNEEPNPDTNDFYGTEYYGGYGDYYEIPWWVGAPAYIVSPDYINNNQTRDRNNSRTSSTEDMRNSSGRGNTDRNSGIINTAPPTTSGSSGSTVTKTTTTRDSSSNNSSDNNSNTNSSSSNNTRSSGGSDTRNNSGSRNSDSGRR